MRRHASSLQVALGPSLLVCTFMNPLQPGSKKHVPRLRPSHSPGRRRLLNMSSSRYRNRRRPPPCWVRFWYRAHSFSAHLEAVLGEPLVQQVGGCPHVHIVPPKAGIADRRETSHWSERPRELPGDRPHDRLLGLLELRLPHFVLVAAAARPARTLPLLRRVRTRTARPRSKVGVEMTSGRVCPPSNSPDKLPTPHTLPAKCPLLRNRFDILLGQLDDHGSATPGAGRFLKCWTQREERDPKSRPELSSPGTTSASTMMESGRRSGNPEGKGSGSCMWARGVRRTPNEKRDSRNRPDLPNTDMTMPRIGDNARRTQCVGSTGAARPKSVSTSNDDKSLEVDDFRCPDAKVNRNCGEPHWQKAGVRH